MFGDMGGKHIQANKQHHNVLTIYIWGANPILDPTTITTNENLIWEDFVNFFLSYFKNSNNTMTCS
jgi:hypothetical protein